MLILSRKRDEQAIATLPVEVMRAAVEANREIEITTTVVEIRGDKVRLGFDAPREVPIHRCEVHDAIKRSRKPQAVAEQPRAELLTS